MNEKDTEVIYINGEPVYDANHYNPGKKQKPMRGSKKCKHCGALLPGNASYCDVCGQPCDDTIPVEKYAKKVHNKAVRKKATNVELSIYVIIMQRSIF